MKLVGWFGGSAKKVLKRWAFFADKNLGFSDRLNYAGANWRHLY